MSITIVGASLAGLQAAQALRRADYTDPITMVGDEPHYPYDRPPLSKQYLAGDWDDEKLRLRAAADPEELGITWRLGSAAASLDLDGRSIELADGSAVAHDGLIIATGAAARSLPGGDLVGVHLLRSLDHARGLRAAFDQQPSRVCVIGAGFIGAEVAATARGRGLEVTMVEAAVAPLARVLDLGAGQAIAELHRSHGVDVRLGVGVSKLIGESGRVTAVELADGSVIEADVVVVGIGVVPNTEWLEGSGLTIDNGVVCDATCLAAPGVVAAGDVARWPNTRFGAELTRVEQWDNAVDQGSYVAKRLLAWLEAAALGDTALGDTALGDTALGDTALKDAVLGNTEVEPFAPVPWFWSDQYDRKIQLAGLPRGEAELVHGTLEEQRFVQLYGEGDEFFGALAWNRPRQAIMARQLLERGGSMAEARTDLGDV